MTKIDKHDGSNNIGNRQHDSSSSTRREKTKFGKFMSDVADGALDTVSAVAPAIPGGRLVKMAADGLQGLREQTPGALGPGGEDEMSEMWEMQRRNQAYNMQYLQLQQEAQEQNRRFKTLSNLMKVRHDTAKSAINNMRA